MVKKKLFGCLGIILGIGGIISYLFVFMRSPSDTAKNIRESLHLTKIAETIFMGHKDYAFETCYSGNPALPSRLFAEPFKRTDSYICNNDLLKIYGSDQLSILASKAESDLGSIFNIAYKDFEKEKETPQLFWYGYAVSGKQEYCYGNDEMTELIKKIYTDNHTSLETEITTDKCLVYYDNGSLIVRCMLFITPYETDSLEDLAQILRLDSVELGEEYSKIVEVSYVTMTDGADMNDYKISEITFQD